MEKAIKESIKELAEKAKSAPSHEALHLSQSALNLVHVLAVMKQNDLQS